MEQHPSTQFFGKIRVQFRRYVGVVQRIWWLLPLTVSIGMLIAAVVIFQSPPAFMSISQMTMPGQLALDQGSSSAYSEDRTEDFNGTQKEDMNDPQVLNKAAQRVAALHPELPPMKADFTVMVKPGTENFILTATSPSPVYSQAFLDAAMDEYLNFKKAQLYKRTDDTADAINEEMKKLDKEMADNDAAMLTFEKNNDVSFLEKESNSGGSYLVNLNQQLDALTTEYNLLGMQDVDETLDRQQAAMQAATANPADGTSKGDTALFAYGPIADYQKARQELAAEQAQLADMSTRLKPEHPQILALNESIKQTESLIGTLKTESAEELKTHRSSVGIQIKNLNALIAAQRDKTLQLSVPLAEYTRLKTVSDRTKSEYDRELATRGNVEITKNVTEDSLVVKDQASLAESVRPGVFKVMILGILAGLVIGLIVIFVLDKMDDRISSLLELQTLFPEPLLGQIPKEALDSEGALLKPGDERQAFIEAFRTLRSSLIFLPVEGERPKTFVITSALPDEGKTTVSSNLAVTLAFSGAKVLLIDADMRSGKVSHLFGAQGAVGLSNVLTKKLPWKEAVSATWIDNLYLMPCGPAVQNTAEHLLGKVTDEFIKNVYSEFDYVLFDSPPVIILDDTLSLSPKIDATLFVLRFDQSSTRASRRALELLHSRQANVIGLVVNGVALSETEYNYNYSYRQYGTKYQEIKA
jgi:succinoglycan biosynthesis transport protein ExoP